MRFFARSPSRSCRNASPAASLYKGTTIDSPCAAALAAVVDRLETSLPSFIDQVPNHPHASICYSLLAVATMNENTAGSASRPQECLKLGEQRVIAVEHIVERRHRHCVGAMRAKKTAERVNCSRWAGQRNNSRRGRPPHP